MNSFKYKFSVLNDSFWMRYALTQAENALFFDEVPVGAVIVKDNSIIGDGFNLVNLLNDPKYHAEMIAIDKAKQMLNSKYLLDTTLYVTLEPCSMCIGNIILSKISRLVFSSFDPKSGACGSAADISRANLNHEIIVDYGIMAEESSKLLKSFFQSKR